MLTIERERRAIDLKAYRLRHAAEGDCSRVVSDPFLLTEGGELKAAYLDLAEHPEDGPILDAVYQAVRRVRFETSARTRGLGSTSRVFGYLPRITIRRDFCTETSLAREQPSEHAAVVAGSAVVARHYREQHPQLYARHREVATARMLPEYRLEDEVFTSGIINENNPLKYHFDAGNVRGVWSGMLVFREAVAGGMLALPEFDIAVAVKHKSLFLFDGQGILHGVTPMRLLRPDARRYSLVYYSLEQVWNCEPLGAELARIRRKRTEREAKRAATPPTGRP